MQKKNQNQRTGCANGGDLKMEMPKEIKNVQDWPPALTFPNHARVPAYLTGKRNPAHAADVGKVNEQFVTIPPDEWTTVSRVAFLEYKPSLLIRLLHWVTLRPVPTFKPYEFTVKVRTSNAQDMRIELTGQTVVPFSAHVVSSA